LNSGEEQVYQTTIWGKNRPYFNIKKIEPLEMEFDGKKYNYYASNSFLLIDVDWIFRSHSVLLHYSLEGSCFVSKYLGKTNIQNIRMQVLNPCYHQCLQCGIIYECKNDFCVKPFQYGKCVICFPDNI
jgi:hypothetical protein